VEGEGAPPRVAAVEEDRKVAHLLRHFVGHHRKRRRDPEGNRRDEGRRDHQAIDEVMQPVPRSAEPRAFASAVATANHPPREIAHLVPARWGGRPPRHVRGLSVSPCNTRGVATPKSNRLIWVPSARAV